MLIDVSILNAVLAVVLPALVALVAKRCSSGTVKSLLLLLLTVLTVAIQEIVDAGGAFDLSHTLTTIVVQFVLAVGVHYGLLKPTGVTGDNGAILRAVPAGVGKPVACDPAQPVG